MTNAPGSNRRLHCHLPHLALTSDQVRAYLSRRLPRCLRMSEGAISPSRKRRIAAFIPVPQSSAVQVMSAASAADSAAARVKFPASRLRTWAKLPFRHRPHSQRNRQASHLPNRSLLPALTISTACFPTERRAPVSGKPTAAAPVCLLLLRALPPQPVDLVEGGLLFQPPSNQQLLLMPLVKPVLLMRTEVLFFMTSVNVRLVKIVAHASVSSRQMADVSLLMHPAESVRGVNRSHHASVVQYLKVLVIPDLSVVPQASSDFRDVRCVKIRDVQLPMTIEKVWGMATSVTVKISPGLLSVSNPVQKRIICVLEGQLEEAMKILGNFVIRQRACRHSVVHNHNLLVHHSPLHPPHHSHPYLLLQRPAQQQPAAMIATRACLFGHAATIILARPASPAVRRLNVRRESDAQSREHAEYSLICVSF